MTTKTIIQKLKSLGNPKDVEGMARFGIKSDPDKIFGVRLPVMRKLAKEIGTNHKLAIELWNAGYRETRLLAGMIAGIKKTDEKLMDRWIKDFDSWEICDETLMNLFWKSPIAFKKAIEWSRKEKEFEKRAGFALMACLASFSWLCTLPIDTHIPPGDFANRCSLAPIRPFSPLSLRTVARL